MNHKQFLVLEASAGSGKTYALALRYVYLLLEGGKINEILALTFTNKAVSEMHQRIGDFLFLLGQPFLQEQDQKKREKLLEELEEEYGWQKEAVLERAPALLQTYWSQKPRISTLDSFFNSILRKFCWYVGVSHSFQIGEVDFEWVEEKFLSSLNSTQRKKMINLCLSHQKNLDEMCAMIDQAREKFMDCTIEYFEDSHQLSSMQEEILEIAKTIKNVVREHPQSTQEALSAVDFENFSSLMKRGSRWIFKGNDTRYFKKLNLDPELFIALREKLKAYWIAQEKEFTAFLDEVCLLEQNARDAYSRQEGILEFSDITAKVYQLLCRERIPNDFFYFRLDSKISHILLDEFQDTSIVQYKILFPLIEEILSGEGRIGNRSFFVVGDKKQSIYRFRGGYGKLLETVRDLPHLSKKELENNYRSHTYIVDFVNEIFTPLFNPYISQKSDKNGGYVKVCDVIEQEDDHFEDHLFPMIKNQIQEFLDCGIGLEEIAILAFTNDDVVKIGDFLKDYFSPIVTRESVSLIHKKDAQILLSSLKCSLSPSLLEKKRLAKLLGKSLDDSIEILDFKNESIGRYIYRAMQFYKLNSKVAKQVLEIACLSKNDEDFLQQVKRCTGSQDDQNGLRILTIHASKGLEFKHLIVLDRLGSPRNQQGGFFCQYDKDLRGRVFVKNQDRKMIDAEYQRVLEAEEQEWQEEKKNLLYVALTRACDSLVIMPVVKKRSASEFQSIGLVQETLNLFPLPRGVLQSDKKEVKRPKDEIEVICKNYGKQEGFLQKEKEIVCDYQSAKYGEIFHKALELYLGYGIKIQELFSFLKYLYGEWLNDEGFEKIMSSIKQIKNLLEIHFGSYEIQSEVPFIRDFKLSRIDCLLFCRDLNQNLSKIFVIDYKTGSQRKQDFVQVRKYVDFVAKQYPQVQVEGYLLYLKDFNLVQIDAKGEK